MDALCPECQSQMQWLEKHDFSCAGCQIRYQQAAKCPKCFQQLERLQACGTANYFCLNSDGMISKRQVIFEYNKYEKSV